MEVELGILKFEGDNVVKKLLPPRLDVENGRYSIISVSVCLSFCTVRGFHTITDLSTTKA